MERDVLHVHLLLHHLVLSLIFKLSYRKKKKKDSLVAQTVKCLPAIWETQVQSLGQEDPLEKEVATHSSIHAWKIPWTEEPVGLWSLLHFYSQNIATLYFLH